MLDFHLLAFLVLLWWLFFKPQRFLLNWKFISFISHKPVCCLMVACDEIQIIGQINEDPRSLKFIQKLSLTFTNDKNVTAYVAISDCSLGNHNSSPNLVILVFFFYLCRPQRRSSSMAKKTQKLLCGSSRQSH